MCVSVWARSCGRVRACVGVCGHATACVGICVCAARALGLASFDFVLVDAGVVAVEGEPRSGAWGLQAQRCAVAASLLRGRRGVNAAFTEALVLLPGTYQMNTYTPEWQPALHRPAGRPRVVLAAFHSSSKLEPRVFGVWMAVLAACPHCELWLLEVRVCLPSTWLT
jgi:hypothetical protein